MASKVFQSRQADAWAAPEPSPGVRIQQSSGQTHHCLRGPVPSRGPTGGWSCNRLALGPLPLLLPASDLQGGGLMEKRGTEAGGCDRCRHPGQAGKAGGLDSDTKRNWQGAGPGGLRSRQTTLCALTLILSGNLEGAPALDPAEPPTPGLTSLPTLCRWHQCSTLGGTLRLSDLQEA